MSDKPIVIIPANYLFFQETTGHAVKQQYIPPLVEVTGCVPLLVPVIGKDFDLKAVAGRIDGILLTGSLSHVSPSCYGAEREFEDHHLDEKRDSTTLPLIRTAIEMDIPLLAICRGFQELNVALGGTLHQYVHKQPGKKDHRHRKDLPYSEQYEHHAHKVIRENGGIFERLHFPKEFTTNSLHTQGIDKLGHGLHVEGVSEDGLIEAISYPGKKFILGVQWHPEGDFRQNSDSVKIFKAFGQALRGQ